MGERNGSSQYNSTDNKRAKCKIAPVQWSLPAWNNFLMPTRKWYSDKVQVLFSGQSAARWAMHNNEIAYAGAAIQSATMFSCMRPAAIVKHSITQLCREQRSNRKPVTKECLPLQQTHTLAGHVYHRPHNLAPTTICIAACTRTQHSSHVML